MNTAHRHTLLTLFAIAEGATGLGLVVAPSILFVLLFEARPVASEAPLIARICGAALLALAAASWGARDAEDRRSTLGLLVGVALYNFLTTAVLTYSALVLEMVGILLWPAIHYHAATSLWCLLAIWRAR
ncbi:hypothetical protein [Rhizobium ruizarguesonis]|jgi:hypothetical protein|uniref:hypothetical protein n=1 Tax=Rhizobium ruizarguesonis TaxID=2081791 RepID=UPI00102FEB4E|nr:hypothetical protein [Rhizobium ruizarguesonis]MBY5880477.1 hypothetical protein [Rhizobium leguminosarum]TBY84464.1 hypothetical protein E0H40_29305 [Rhizobium leguminosarum bv. viciae]NEH34653.1 hypothetical protein [Rhizobium ruizarguesonis]NEH81361.1 hypothetical protein [Rhizobium ruizarguesonis]NEI81321.1 hypothetical protein [Rhizobium ruizarguesonis]